MPKQYINGILLFNQVNIPDNILCIIHVSKHLEGWMSGLNRTPGKRVQVEWPDAGSNPAPSAINFNFH